MNDNNSNNNDKNEYKKINNIPNIPNWDLISKTAYQARKFVDTNPIKGLINSGVFDSLKPVKDSLPEIFNQAKITNDLLKKINIDNYLPGSLEYSETFKAFSDLVNNSNITDYFDMHYKTIKDLNFYNNSNIIDQENINEELYYDGTITNTIEIENDDNNNQIYSSNCTDCEIIIEYESKLNKLIYENKYQENRIKKLENDFKSINSGFSKQNEKYSDFLTEKSLLESKINSTIKEINDDNIDIRKYLNDMHTENNDLKKELNNEYNEIKKDINSEIKGDINSIYYRLNNPETDKYKKYWEPIVIAVIVIIIQFILTKYFL